ncbi:hypothetical protein JXO59_07585 [candidate division KSB1 bacterium]|nr:hypothetical protein [candidate division KSB1 bacterium]
MSIAVFLSKIPWIKLLTAVPPMVRTARDLMQSAQKAPALSASGEEGTDLHQRVAALEVREKKQSELVQKMSEQLQVTTETLQILSARLQVIFILALFSILLAVTAIILWLK